jgi:ABC-2 type transport system permease protein
MQVFRAYFKVMRASAGAISIYVAIFLGLSVAFSLAEAPQETGDFAQTRTSIAVINRDGEAPLAQGLADYLADTSGIVPYPDNPEKLQDALFFRNVEYIAIIPAGFSTDFLSGRDCAVQKVTVSGSISSRYVDMRIDKYLRTARLRHQYGGDQSHEELAAAIRADLAQETPVTVLPSSATNGSEREFVFYYRYFAYAVLATIMMGVSAIMMAFNKPDLRRRSLCTPIPARSANLQLAAGHTIFALGCWSVLVLFSFVLYGRNLLSSGLVWLYCMNTLAFTVVSASIGFLVGSSVRSNGAQAGAVNVIANGMSFVCGVFVPQSILSKHVLDFGRFLPAYWYVKANDAISGLSRPTASALRPIYGDVLIQLAFAAAIFAVTLLITKERQAE